MTERTLHCGDCSETFTSWDDLAEHVIESHDYKKNELRLTDRNPQQPEIMERPRTNGQQNILAPIAENPTEAEQLVETIGEQFATSKKVSIRGDLYLSIVATTVVLFVLAAVTFLTYREIISGSVFAFALGTLIGYLLSFLEDLR